jgi:sugar phosphate isomerase/epimerase
LLVGAAAAGLLALSARAADQPATTRATTGATTRAAAAKRYRISASDWMLLKRQKPGALQLAHDCGLDGIEVDMGPLGTRPDFESKLPDEQFRTSYVESAGKLGLEISSLAMSAFYGQSFVKHPKAEAFALACIDLMPKLGTKTAFVPVMTRADMKKEDKEADAAVQQQVIELFKRIAPTAEKAKVVLGISTQLDGDGNRRLLDAIGSPAVKIAYNVGERIDAGGDVYKELQTLGRDGIAQIIPTLSDGVWLKNDKRIDVPKLKQLLDGMNWSGWLVLQRSRDRDHAKDVKYNFSANAAYLRSIFQS